MNYKLLFSEIAEKQVAAFLKSNPTAFEKLKRLLKELQEDPRTGTGKPKKLKGNLAGCYSRRITAKHRLVYEIIDESVLVHILSVEGHYRDK